MRPVTRRSGEVEVSSPGFMQTFFASTVLPISTGVVIVAVGVAVLVVLELEKVNG